MAVMVATARGLASHAIHAGWVAQPAFLFVLARDGSMDKRTVARCLRAWEETGRFKKRHVARWRRELQGVR